MSSPSQGDKFLECCVVQPTVCVGCHLKCSMVESRPRLPGLTLQYGRVYAILYVCVGAN